MGLRDIVRRLPIGLRNRAPVVAVVRLEGVIAPRRWRGALALEGCDKLFERAFALPHLAAVALSINSPGGSPVQSALL